MCKKLTAIATCLLLASCGNTEYQTVAIGQAKKLTVVTPLICMEYPAFEISLGVLRNGSGSMSTQDMWFTVTNMEDISKLRRAVEHGSIVHVTYNMRRWAPCSEDAWMTSITVENNS